MDGARRITLPSFNDGANGKGIMSEALVECVPNFSEGTDARRVEAIVAAMRVEGVRLLDWSMDAAHNRSVVTIAGDPAAVVESAVRGAGKAAELIDLTRQQGVHPRIGAADVIPFVPISGIKLEQCALLARQAGLEIWRRFSVPVFSMRRRRRVPTAPIWKRCGGGSSKGCSRRCGKDSARRPDIGGPLIHPTAGACAVGARKFLVAYNIYFDSSGCRHGARHGPRDSRRFRRIEGRQGYGRAGEWPRTAHHEHYRFHGDAGLSGLSHGQSNWPCATRPHPSRARSLA